ncbi:biofilm development regulator YmgB/AriR family protein [Pantoea sp. EA-12]|uniref:biofilm development regulator YmgB/AriR family protein n=1 Tax=Pantoea sp. EA-12 TaxID=3043303 RepID=UPI0024B4D950|nr:biofilm development regulator YmgB/AriR family protein [Pantoea sp. EA-12]MDI9221623.1 biofilm development regulator YmgB/AriR family protein [Pantoea sp. EA-12]
MMQNNDDILSALTDTRLASFMRSAGPEAKDEAALLNEVICSVLVAEGRVTNKSLILHLIRELESACSDRQADTLRRTLEIVVGHTPDD